MLRSLRALVAIVLMVPAPPLAGQPRDAHFHVQYRLTYAGDDRPESEFTVRETARYSLQVPRVLVPTPPTEPGGPPRLRERFDVARLEQTLVAAFNEVERDFGPFRGRPH